MPRRALSCLVTLLALSASFASLAQASGTVTLFRNIPQFGIYVGAPPPYTPPKNITMWDYGTVFLTRLAPKVQAAIGSDLVANVTYLAQCDNYDRQGSLFAIVKDHGVAPVETDPRIELVRWITPFSDYKRGVYATHAYPAATLAPYRGMLADTTHDVWVGIQGGSNPYSGDPCTGSTKSPDYQAVGFRYTVSLSSTTPFTPLSAAVSAPIPVADYITAPITGTASAPVTGAGAITIIISGHGSSAGGDEYKHTNDTVMVNGVMVGTFSTMIDCAPYKQFSPDGNPGIFENNLTSNPRNWCPGALVPSHNFPATIGSSNSVSISLDDERVPNGSYYETSAYLLPN